LTEADNLDPFTFLHGDAKSPAVRQVFGTSGTGKTTLLEHWSYEAVRSKQFPKNWRLVIVDVKAEDYSDLVPPLRDLEAVMESINKNRITLFYPNVHTAHLDVEQLVDYLFYLSDQAEDFSATMILEESSTYITAHTVPPQLKRMAVQGRSKKLTIVLANQRMMTNLWIDTQTAHLLAFQCAIPDRAMIQKRWGIDGESMSSRLAQLDFSWAHFDFNSLSLKYYAPVELQDLKLTEKQTQLPKEKGRFSRLFKLD
jgi:hypothetical protein